MATIKLTGNVQNFLLFDPRRCTTMPNWKSNVMTKNTPQISIIESRSLYSDSLHVYLVIKYINVIMIWRFWSRPGQGKYAFRRPDCELRCSANHTIWSRWRQNSSDSPWSPGTWSHAWPGVAFLMRWPKPDVTSLIRSVYLRVLTSSGYLEDS